MLKIENFKVRRANFVVHSRRGRDFWASVDKDLIKDIIRNPDQCYVAIYNAEFPGGAARGQLSNRGQSK